MDTEILPALEFARGQSVGATGVVEFLSAFAGRPLRLEIRESAANFVAIHAIAALVRPTAGGVLDAAPGYNFRNDLGELADAIVLFRLSNVKRLIVYGVLGRFEHANHGRDDVANVHDGTPGCAVALDVDAAGSHGRGDEIVQYQVETEARRSSVSGGIPHVSWSEGLVGKAGNVPFDKHFRLSVRSDWVQVRVLVQKVIACCAVRAAGRGKHEAFHAGVFGQFSKPHRGFVVNVEGETRIQVPKRIIRQ